MAKYPNLWKRGNAYYLRMRVPLDLVQTLRKEHVVRSLRTSDHRTALERYRRAQAEIEEQFAAIRQGRASAARSEAAIAAGDLNRLSHREIEALVVDWFAARPDLQPVAPIDPDDIATEIDWKGVADETAASRSAFCRTTGFPH